MPGGQRARFLMVAVVGALLISVLGQFTGDARLVFINILLFASMGLAWGLMGGYAGLFSFGHAAYFGIGAYAVAVAQVDFGLVPWIAVPVGAAVAAVLAATTTFLALRYKLHGIFFALATFAVAEMIRLLVTGSEILKRAGGYRVPLKPGDSWLWMQFRPDSPGYYFLAVLLFLTAVTVSVLVARTKLGYMAVAARDDEQAMEAVGLSPMRTRVLVSMISAAVASLSGVFYFQYYFTINPDLGFGQAVSVLILLPAIIGGSGTILGPIVGAVVLGTVHHFLSLLVTAPPEWFTVLENRTGVDQIVYGVILIGIILLLPRGIYASLKGWRHARA